MNKLIKTFMSDENEFKDTVRDLLYKKSLESVEDYKKNVGKQILELEKKEPMDE